jgi:hypothetical protein
MTVTCPNCTAVRELCSSCGFEAIALTEGKPLRSLFFSSGYRRAAVCIITLRLGLAVANWTTRRKVFMCKAVCTQVLFLRGHGGCGYGLCSRCSAQLRDARAMFAAAPASLVN